MNKITLARLWVGLSLCVLSASLTYDRMVVGEVLGAGTTEWSARESGSEARPTGVAIALASKPAQTWAAISYAFDDDKVRMHAEFQFAWSKEARPAARSSGARVALAWDMSRWL